MKIRHINGFRLEISQKMANGQLLFLALHSSHPIVLHISLAESYSSLYYYCILGMVHGRKSLQNIFFVIVCEKIL